MERKTTALRILLSLILITLVFIANAQVIYVDQAATGANDGSSWIDAYTDLQTGIDAASAMSTPALPVQVWVAAGTYKPTTTTDRTISLIMRNEVEIYGGFTGIETTISQRDWRINSTILSGDIGVQGVATDNSQSVINNEFTAASPLSNTAILDGFIIEDGYMDNASLVGGAGMRNFRASPTIRNCVFRNNICAASVSLLGPALTAYSDSYPIIVNSEFHHNEGRRASAVSIFSTESFSNPPTVKIFGCLFYENTAQQEFGPLVIQTLGSVEVINNTIVDNVVVTPETGSNAALYGSGITHYGGNNVNLILENNILWNNGSPFELMSNFLTANANIIQGDLSPSTSINSNLNLFNFDPQFTDAVNDDYTLNYCSGANDLGISSVFTDFPTEDLQGNSRVFNTIIDFGAYEEPSSIKTTITAVETADVSCNGGSDGLVNFNASASFGPVSYSLDGINFNAVSSFNGLTQGNYVLYARDASGCLDSIDFVIGEPLPIDITSVNTESASCNGLSNGEITIEVNGGSAPYQALIDGTAFSQFNNSFTYDQLTAGSYTLTIRDANNCLFNYAPGFNISEPAALGGTAMVTDVLCNGANDGNIEVSASGGTAPYLYSIDGTNFQSSNIFSSLVANTYLVEIRDANNCSFSTNEVVNEPTILSLAISNVSNASCSGKADGSITVVASGGTAPYEYRLANGLFVATPLFTSVSEGMYTLTVRDSNGCEEEVVASVLNDVNIGITAQVTNPLCVGEASGEITVTATGGVEPYSYLITGQQNGQVSPTFSDLSAGTYVVEAFDANGCTSETTVTLTNPTVLTLQITSTQVACNGEASGAITAVASGGSSPYEYSIDGTNYQSADTFNGLSSGNYSVFVRDANSCQTSEVNIEIREPEELELSVVQNKRDFTLSGSGGVGPYEYSVDGTTFQSSENFNNLEPGSYAFTLRDANGCSVVSSAFEVVLGITSPEISIYPNPTSEILEIKGVEFDRLEIYDLQGKRVLISNKKSVSVGSRNKGIYVLRVYNNGREIHNQKLIIN